MEDRRPGPEQADDKKTTSRGGEFLAAWFKRLRTPETSEETTESDNPKKSRAKRLFSRLFPSIATKEEVRESDAPRPSFYEAFSFNLSDNREEQSPERPDPALSETSDIANVSSAETTPVEQGTETSVDAPSAEPSLAAQASERHASTLPPVEAPVRPHPAIMEELATDSQLERQKPGESTTAFYERRAVAAPDRTANTEEIPGADRLARSLIGLEYIGRHRADAKLKKADKLTQKNVASLSKKIEADMKSGDQLARLANSSKEQIEELRHKREQAVAAKAEKAPTPPKTPEVKPVIIEKLPKSPQTAEKTPIVSTPERLVPVRELKVSSERIKDSAEQKSAPTRPEVILERVAKAAERDDPIEIAYERRHEIKDEPKQLFAASTSGPVHIGSILASNIAQNPATGPQLGGLARQNNTVSGAPSSMYKQAAVSGFWTALMLVVIATVLAVFNL